VWVLHTHVRAPKANAYCERLVGRCVIHSARILRRCLSFSGIMKSKHSRNQGRPNLSLGPGIPEPTAVFLPLQGHDRHSLRQDCKVAARVVLGGLHHEYRWERIAA
jgi:putative transposase